MPIGALRSYRWYDPGSIQLITAKKQANEIQIKEKTKPKITPVISPKPIELKESPPEVDHEAIDNFLAKEKARKLAERKEADRIAKQKEAEEREYQRQLKLAREQAQREYQALIKKLKDEADEAEAVEIALAVNHYLDNHPY